jgi:hypothetical protein
LFTIITKEFDKNKSKSNNFCDFSGSILLSKPLEYSTKKSFLPVLREIGFLLIISDWNVEDLLYDLNPVYAVTSDFIKWSIKVLFPEFFPP